MAQGPLVLFHSKYDDGQNFDVFVEHTRHGECKRVQGRQSKTGWHSSVWQYSQSKHVIQVCGFWINIYPVLYFVFVYLFVVFVLLNNFNSHREVAIAVEEQVVILFISLLSMLCIHLKLRIITLHACNIWSCVKLFQIQESVFLVSLLTLRALTWMKWVLLRTMKHIIICTYVHFYVHMLNFSCIDESNQHRYFYSV